MKSRIYPAPPLLLDDLRAQAGQIEGDEGQDEPETFEGIGGCEAAVLELEAT